MPEVGRADLNASESGPPTRSIGGDDLQRWVGGSRSDLGVVGINATFGRAPCIGGLPGATWVSMSSPIAYGRLIRSADGTTTVVVHGMADGTLLLDERHPHTTSAHLADMVAALGGGSLGTLAAPRASLRAGSASPRAVLPAAVMAAAAAAFSVLANRAWFVVLVALAAWTVVALVLEVRWTTLLTVASVFLAASAVAVLIGWGVASDGLAIVAYGLACVGCCAAAATRLRASAPPGP